MYIGNVYIPDNTAALAPMAGVADYAFRSICKEYGASYVVGEMASAKGLIMSGRKTEELLFVTEPERPMAVQIFGDDPDIMAEAALHCLKFSPDIIDINMGCPAPKIAGNGGGSALMKNPELAGRIINAVVKKVSVPVTAKIRKAWDENNINAVYMAKILEYNGASAITVHGKTRLQRFAPPVDIEIIKQVKKAVAIPVIANGDITSGESAKNMLEYTGADLVMIGRGAYGNPWIFSEIKEYLQNGKTLDNFSINQRFDVMLKHIKFLCENKGERVGMREARKHAAWYMKGLRDAAIYRKMVDQLKEYSELVEISEIIKNKNL